MGFDDGQIILDHANGAYYAGQTVYGRMVFSQGKEKTIHGIYADMKGFCKVHWTTTHSRRENDRTVHTTVNHDSYEEYFRNKTFLIGSDNGTHHLKEGQHEFMFNFTIPMNCPSSFEGSDGHIRYRVKVVMVTSGMFSMNKDKWVAVRVHAPLDLNLDPYCREPMEYDLSNSYCCWCVNSGYSEVTVRMPVAGYCPGQIIPMEVTCKNESTVEIEEIKFAIKKDVKFLAVSQPGTRTDHDTVAEIKKGPIPGNTTRNWTVEMEVPAMDIYNVRSCSFIDIDYTFKVSTEAEGCHDGTEETRAIVFGTVPLVGFQDNVQNPLHDQLPSVDVQNVNSYPPPPIINQPLADPSYNKGTFNPSNSPYPGNPGFPTTPNNGGSTSPYYPGNQPYPSVSPYPGANPPYPGANPPYPGANPPYPGANPPYPGANPPYPAGNLVSPHESNPNSVPPYPGANPTPGMPYPGARTSPVPPYHAGVSPLKTGTIGFGIPEGDGSKMPLLPMGANVPYHASPYATASAPEPSTPGDDEQKVPLDASSEPPPYNPEFMKNPDKKDEKNEKDQKNEKDEKNEKETK